jgi:hypothetical protein
MIKRKQNTRTINDQKETEHKDYQWSKENKAQRLSMIKRQHSTKTVIDQKEIEHKDIFVLCFPLIIDSLFVVSFWSLIVFLFCFLLIMHSLCVLFPFDQWQKQNTQTINDQKETEHKDYQWSNGNRAQRLSMITLIVYVLFPFDQW